MPQTPYNAPIGVSYYHISAAGTFVAKSVPGALFSLNINSATAGATLELFDQATTATGTVVIAGPINLGTANVLPSHLDIGPSGAGINFKTGLVALTTGTLDVTLAIR
jgi:hypothetical protein